MATLDEILKAKEDRFLRQRAWLARYQLPLLSCSMRIPGPDKQSMRYRRAFTAGVTDLLAHLPVGDVVHWEIAHPETGSEALIAVRMDAIALKQIAIEREDHHPLGALFDFDVIDRSGEGVTRASLRRSARPCLLCDRPAKLCTREKRHPLEELLFEIDRILIRWEECL